MLNKIIKYSEKKRLEVKKSISGGINIYVLYEDPKRKEFESYLKRLKVKYSTRLCGNYDYVEYYIGS